MLLTSSAARCCIATAGSCMVVLLNMASSTIGLTHCTNSVTSWSVSLADSATFGTHVSSWRSLWRNSSTITQKIYEEKCNKNHAVLFVRDCTYWEIIHSTSVMMDSSLCFSNKYLSNTEVRSKIEQLGYTKCSMVATHTNYLRTTYTTNVWNL